MWEQGWNYSRVEGSHAAPPPPPTFEKKKLVCILTKRILILPPFQKKIYKLTQEIQQIDNKKNLLKKKMLIPDNKKNLWKNHKFGPSKNNNNKSITNPSKKKNHKNLITFTQYLPLTWELHAPFKWLHPHSHSPMLHIDRSIHTLVRLWKY